MSATARDYVYEVRVTKDADKNPVPEPTISKEKMDEYKANVEKYFGKMV